MKFIIIQRNWLYLLTALLLFMQSFALWHDVSHPFHSVNVECDRFESISHSPFADLAHSILPIWSQDFSIEQASFTTPYIPQRLHHAHGIRTPPYFS